MPTNISQSGGTFMAMSITGPPLLIFSLDILWLLTPVLASISRLSWLISTWCLLLARLFYLASYNCNVGMLNVLLNLLDKIRSNICYAFSADWSICARSMPLAQLSTGAPSLIDQPHLIEARVLDKWPWTGCIMLTFQLQWCASANSIQEALCSSYNPNKFIGFLLFDKLWFITLVLWKIVCRQFGESWDVSTKLVPLFTQTTLNGCFKDIVFPTLFGLNNNIFSPAEEAALLPWEEREPNLFWRGSSTGKLFQIQASKRQKYRVCIDIGDVKDLNPHWKLHFEPGFHWSILSRYLIILTSCLELTEVHLLLPWDEGYQVTDIWGCTWNPSQWFDCKIPCIGKEADGCFSAIVETAHHGLHLWE